MSLEDEISALRKNREAEQEARLAKEREEALAQVTPEAITRKLEALRGVTPELVESVSLLLGMHTPQLASDVVSYLLQSNKIDNSAFAGLDGLREFIYKTNRKKDIPTVKIGANQADVQIECVQERHIQERELNRASYGTRITVGTMASQSPIAVCVSGSCHVYGWLPGRLENKFTQNFVLSEPREPQLKDLVVAVLADLDI